MSPIQGKEDEHVIRIRAVMISYNNGTLHIAYMRAKGDSDFRISDLVINPHGTDI